MEKPKNKLKEKKKYKRNVSIFTIFLWLFLITIMSTITIGSLNQKNAIEVTDENWNIELMMYDKSSDTPNQAMTEFTWAPENEGDTKQITFQINYTCLLGKSYEPGELEIYFKTLNDKDNFSESHQTDRLSVSHTTGYAIDGYDWNSKYDSDTKTYIFTNNYSIESGENFQGSIQIAYELEPIFKIQTDLDISVTLKENIENADTIITATSNVCNFHYIGNKKSYVLYELGGAAPEIDYTPIEDIVNDYYWVSYDFYVEKNNGGVLNAYGSQNEFVKRFVDYSYGNIECIKETFPDGCVIYDKDLNKVEPQYDNIYYLATRGAIGSRYYNNYYVGYPKDSYNEGDKIVNTAELWGRYEDETEIQKLAEDSVEVRLRDLNFEYTGELYSLVKDSVDNYTYQEIVRSGVKDLEWTISPIAFYTGSKMNIEIGDDLLYLTDKDGNYVKLTDDEYYFTQISIPVFRSYDKYNEGNGEILTGYEWELQVRYAGTDEYVTYETGLTEQGAYLYYLENEKIVAMKLIIKDLDKTLYSGQIRVEINVHSPNIEGVSDLSNRSVKLNNFDYMIVSTIDENGEKKVLNDIGYYMDLDLATQIKQNDLENYGQYLYRTGDYCLINLGHLKFTAYKTVDSIWYTSPTYEYYNYNYTLSAQVNPYYPESEDDLVIKIFDILPKGMTLEYSTPKSVIQGISGPEYASIFLKLKDGTKFSSDAAFSQYLREHTTVEIDDNYRNSGRTAIKMEIHLDDLDYSEYSRLKSSFSIKIKMSMLVPFDSLQENGSNYRNDLYAMLETEENDPNMDIRYWGASYSPYNARVIQDNGVIEELTKDIDDDGILDEDVVYGYVNKTVLNTSSSQQSIIKRVRTNLTYGMYIKGTAQVDVGEEYDYKLRITTGGNSLKDLILYDNIESIINEDGTEVDEGWKGIFLGVDTRYAEEKGYAPKVYYSTELNPGKLTEVPDKWKLLDDSVDKSTVKSICVDLRYNAEGAEMILPPNDVVYVLVQMKAPYDETLKVSSKNMFWTNWKAIDSSGGIIDNVDGIYSNQVNLRMNITNIKTSISGQKTWIDDENKNNTRPESIVVKLYQDGRQYMSKTVTAEDNWSYTFDDIPLYRDNAGNRYVYSIKEDTVANYLTSYEGNNITNKLNLTEFEVEKIWDDNGNVAGKRPESVIVELKREGHVVRRITLNESNNWKYTFKALEKYNNLGEEIIYTVDEKKFTNDEWYVKEIVGGKITNKFVVPNERVKIIASKRWEDNNNLAGKRPTSVVLQIKNGKEVVTEQVVTEKDNWSYEFDLKKYDEDGNEIVYTVDEKSVPSKFYQKVGVEGNVVINQFVVPDEKIEIWVDKKWEDEDNKYGKRPESVILQIKNGETIVEEAEVGEENSWIHKFELSKYDENGNEINYTVDEKETNEYYEKRIEGNTIINTCTYESPVDTSDILVWVYVVILVVAMIGVLLVVIFFVKRKK